VLPAADRPSLKADLELNVIGIRMNEINIDNAQWLRGLTLIERMPRLGVDNGGMTKVKLESAHQRLNRWRAQTPFTVESNFARRMAMDQLTEEDFLGLLGESDESLSDRFPVPPVWIAELQRVLPARTSEGQSAAPVLSEKESRRRESLGFLKLIEPLLEDGKARLREGAQALQQLYPALPFDPVNVEELFLDSLYQTLSLRMTRTVVLELNVLRVKGELEGDTPEERYRNFLKRLGQWDRALDFLHEYPVLTRQLKTCTDQWVAYSVEFLTHLAKDWPTIQETLAPQQDPGQLTSVTVGAGDTHREGRSVMSCAFASGFRLIYKPHSLAVDVHFVDLLKWLNKRGTHPPFFTLKIIDRGAHGWVEFVAASGCETKEELDRFYERQGGYLALLYALEATDFHLENLIAAGEHPVLIDLEALFHGRNSATVNNSSIELLIHELAHSVLRIGLLPQRVWAEGESDGIELSGMGGALGQVTPHGVLQMESPGTDQMRLVRKQIELPGSNNRPLLNGAAVSAHNYVEEIIRGFTSVYQLILKHREELLADDGPFSAFAEDEVRAVLRPTRLYAMLLFESYHPNLLRDALDRDRLLDRIWTSVEQTPHLSRVIADELRDLRIGDIPMFASRPGSRHLWSSRGEQITDFFDEPSLNSVRRRLRDLSEGDLSRQVWFTRASLMTLIMGQGEDQWVHYKPEYSNKIADPERLIAAARKVADRIEVLALRNDEAAMWVGVTLRQERTWTVLPVGSDLYDGNAGIALFLAYLGSITGEHCYTTLAQAALVGIMSQMEEPLSEPKMLGRLGGFSGWGSLIYTLAHLGQLWNQPELFQEAERVVSRLSELIDEDESLDILGGAAGCIAALLSLYQCTSSGNALAMAIRCADRLVARAEPMAHGAAWRTDTAESEDPLAGFSHGTAGIAGALLEIFAVTGDARYRQAALDAIVYERSLFVAEEGNWLDIRESKESGESDPEKKRFMVAWCHGAVGVGLGRLRSLRHIGLADAEVLEEINVALKTTVERGFGSNHCLCHGDLGNLELLLQASLAFGDAQLTRQTYEIATSILDSIDKHGWLCGVPMGVETPGLMTGLAGIGFGLLRLAEPERVPSIVTLAPPPQTDARTEDFLPSSWAKVVSQGEQVLRAGAQGQSLTGGI